jgi:hypothetical protein
MIKVFIQNNIHIYIYMRQRQGPASAEYQGIEARRQQIIQNIQTQQQAIAALEQQIQTQQTELTSLPTLAVQGTADYDVLRAFAQTRTAELTATIPVLEQTLQTHHQQVQTMEADYLETIQLLGTTRYMEQLETDLTPAEMGARIGVPFQKHSIIGMLRTEIDRIHNRQVPQHINDIRLPTWLAYTTDIYKLDYYRLILQFVIGMIDEESLICPSQCDIGGNEVYRICEIHRTTQRGVYDFMPQAQEPCLWFTKDSRSGLSYAKPHIPGNPPTPVSITIKRRLLDVAQFEERDGTISERSLSMNLNLNSRLPVPLGRNKLLNSMLLHMLITLVVQKIIKNPRYQFDETTGNFLAHNVPALPGQPQSIINLIELYKAFGADPEQETYNDLGIPEQPYQNTGNLNDPNRVTIPTLRISSENRGRRMSRYVEDKVLAYNFVEIFDCITDIFQRLSATSTAGISDLLDFPADLVHALNTPPAPFQFRILGYYASNVEVPGVDVTTGIRRSFHSEQCIDSRYFLRTDGAAYKIFRPMSLRMDAALQNPAVPNNVISRLRGGGKEEDDVSLIYDIDITGYPINFLMENALLQKELTEINKLLTKIKNNIKIANRKTANRKTRSRKTANRKTRSRKTANRKTRSRKTRSRKTRSRKTRSNYMSSFQKFKTV